MNTGEINKEITLLWIDFSLEVSEVEAKGERCSSELELYVANLQDTDIGEQEDFGFSNDGIFGYNPEHYICKNKVWCYNVNVNDARCFYLKIDNIEIKNEGCIEFKTMLEFPKKFADFVKRKFNDDVFCCESKEWYCPTNQIAIPTAKKFDVEFVKSELIRDFVEVLRKEYTFTVSDSRYDELAASISSIKSDKDSLNKFKTWIEAQTLGLPSPAIEGANATAATAKVTKSGKQQRRLSAIHSTFFPGDSDVISALSKLLFIMSLISIVESNTKINCNKSFFYYYLK